MIVLLIGLILLGVFVLRFREDRRRLSNGIYLLLGLVFTGVWLVADDRSGLLPVLTAVLIVLSPLLVLVLAGLLIFNGWQMVQREGVAVPNLLSMGAGIALLVPYLLFVLAIRAESFWLAVAIASATLMVTYIGFVFVSFVVYSLVYGYLPYKPGVAAIVVHGSGLLDTRVPPLLASRLDRAMQIYRTEYAAGRFPLVVTSGGKGPDELVSEASAMVGYLVAQGMPPESLVQEDRSKTTQENLRFTKQLLAERGINTRIVLVTSNFHVLRTAIFARDLHLDAEVVGARTAFYYLPSAVLREFAAILFANKRVNMVACLLCGALPVLVASVAR